MLDLCTDELGDDWVRIPGDGPATAIVAGMHDPGGNEPRTRPLVGHTIAVYEPDPSLSMVWPVPDEDPVEAWHRNRESGLPEWAENDSDEWKSARPGWVVILRSGSPIWQARVWYLDWGSGAGGYVSDFQPLFSDNLVGPRPELLGWETSTWAVGLARLINTFSATGQFVETFDPTDRLCPEPIKIHPVDAERLSRV